MNLFPKNVQIQPSGYIEDPETEALKIKGSYLFDFVKGEFVKDPNGKILKVKAVEGYLQWYEKVLRTKRFVHSSYTDLYGEEYYTLIGSDMTKSALELEVKRMTIEALMVHPFTEKVNRFDFKWDEHKSELYFSFHAYTVFGEEYTLEALAEVRR